MAGIAGKLASFLGGSPIFSSIFVYGSIFVVVALAGTYFYMDHRIETLKVEKASLEVDVREQKLNVKECKARVAEINRSIDRMSEDSEQKKEIIDMLSEHLGTLSDLSQDRIGDIRDEDTPETCEDAFEFIRDNLEKVKWK